jgi:hypothetical protein
MWRVTRDVCALGAALAGTAGWIAGTEGALGAGAGAVLALGNFRWLVTRACAASEAGRALWSMAAGLRLVAVGVPCAAVLAAGWAHPVALVAGLTTLPCALVAHGLRAARQES